MRWRGGAGSQLSGSLGGVVASSSGGGVTLRNRSVPTRASSKGRERSRSFLGIVSTFWSTLSPELRAAWGSVAASVVSTNRLGDDRSRAGFQFFVSVNVHRLACGGGILNDPRVAYSGFSWASELTATMSVNYGFFLIGDGFETCDHLLILVSAPLSAGRRCRNVRFSQWFGAVLTPPTAQPYVAPIDPGAFYRFGGMVAGQRRIVRVVGSRGPFLGAAVDDFTTVTL